MSVILTGAGETLIRATTREELSRWHGPDEGHDPGGAQRTALEAAVEGWVTRITGRLAGAPRRPAWWACPTTVAFAFPARLQPGLLAEMVRRQLVE